jgi:arginine repressor
MPRTKKSNGNTKSELVRGYIAQHPQASVREIVDSLRQQGTSVSIALASKIKYDRMRKGTGRGRAPATAAAAINGSAGGTKAAAIRQMAGSMERPVRPRDLVAAMAAQGVQVSSAQVSQVLRAMGMRRRRRGGARVAREAAPMGRRPVSNSASRSISLDSLIAAKKLADQLGGVDAAKLAVDALSRLS